MSEFEQTHKQIVDRYNAKKAIYEAMVSGRHISLFDTQEFRVAEMHTMICQIRQDIERKNLPWVMRNKWISPNGKKVKEYWLESNN